MKCLRYILLLSIFCGAIDQAKAQTEADSLELLVLRDSMLNAISQKADRQGIAIGEELYRQAEAKNYYSFMVEAYMHMARAYNFMAIADTSRMFYRRACALAESQGMYESLSANTSNIGITHFQDGTYDSAEYYFVKAADIARELAPRRLAICMGNVAWIYGVMDDRERELEAYLAAIKAVDEIPDSFRGETVRMRSLGGLADYYLFAKEYDKAKDIYEQKLALGEKSGDIRIQKEAHAGLGALYRQDAYYDFEESKQHYEFVTSDTTRTEGHYRYQAMQGLAKLYRKEGLRNEAIGYFKQVYDYYDNFRVDDFRASAATSMGEIYLEMSRLSEADRWLNIALEAAKRGNMIARERDALRSKYKVDSLRGRFRTALAGYQRMHFINDSLQSERSQNRIKELEIQYETEQTENENLALKNDLELKQAQVEQQQIVQIFVAVVAITFIVLALVIYRNYQRKKMAGEIISQQADELKTLSRFKDGLTSMVVHDMRNPLNAILGFSQGTPTDDKLRNINRSGHQVLNLVNNMLDIQRFEEAKVSLNVEVVNAKQLVADTIQEISLIAASKSLKVTSSIPDALLYRVDPVLINRVLVNLLINSVKYSKSGGDIFVEVGQEQDGFQELIVRDEGHGIPSDQLPYIFNKFWHNDPGRSGILPSTGLGLSFSKMAVEAHEGSIRAESVLHQGTSIYLMLPLADKAVEVSKPDAEEASLEGMIVPADQEIFSQYLPELEQLEVFEISEINKLLKSIESQVTDKRFGSQLRSAAFQGDQALYEQLLDQIRKEAVV